MPSPLIFFVFVIVIDLVLKSYKDKKKMEETRRNKEEELRTGPNLSQSKSIQKPVQNKNILATLKEEVEKERQREIARRQVSTKPMPSIKPKIEKKEIVQKTSVATDYWDQREKDDYKKESEKPVAIQNKNSQDDFRKDIIRGIIFSEILSEPKSIQNQKRSM